MNKNSQVYSKIKELTTNNLGFFTPFTTKLTGLFIIYKQYFFEKNVQSGF